MGGLNSSCRNRCTQNNATMASSLAAAQASSAALNNKCAATDRCTQYD